MPYSDIGIRLLELSSGSRLERDFAFENSPEGTRYDRQYRKERGDVNTTDKSRKQLVQGQGLTKVTKARLKTLAERCKTSGKYGYKVI